MERFTSHHIPLHQAILRLDGQYGDYALVRDLDKLGFPSVMRGKDYGLFDHPEIRARLAQAPDQEVTHRQTETTRALFDCLDVALTPMGPRIRVIVATHPAAVTPARISTTRDGVVDEIPYPLPQRSHLLQDLGFLGFKLEGIEIEMPIKKPRGGKLTDEQKETNQALARRRVAIEHGNRLSVE